MNRSILLILFAMTLLGCSPSPGPDSQEAEANTAKQISPESIENKSIDKGEKTNVVSRDDLEIKFEEMKLTRLNDYIKYSKLIFKHSEALGGLLQEFYINYDWKTSAESSKPYLKGGKTDPLGKLLLAIPEKYYAPDTYLGLAEIVDPKNKSLLKELIDFFTSEPYLSKEGLSQLKEAIGSNNAAIIEASVDQIYKKVFEEFSQKYHTGSRWDEIKGKTGNVDYKLAEEGFTVAHYASFYGQKITGPDGETSSEFLIISQTRKIIVKLFILLIRNYFDKPQAIFVRK